MSIRSTVAAAAAILAFAAAGQAAAAPSLVTAKLETPLAGRVQLVAGGAVFVCDGDECVANAPTSRTFAAATCKALVKKFGLISAFERGSDAFDAERLAACNAAGQPRTETASR